jgi:hypothetical protein
METTILVLWKSNTFIEMLSPSHHNNYDRNIHTPSIHISNGRRANDPLREEAWGIFKKLDRTNNGRIPIVDVQQHLKVMKQAFQDLGVHLKDEYFKNMIEDMDEDRDGVVTFEEFEKTLRKGTDLMQRAKTGQLIIPDFPEFCEELKQIYNEVKPVKAGKEPSSSSSTHFLKVKMHLIFNN